MNLSPEILALDSERCFARWRGLLVQCWHETRFEAVVEHTAILKRMLKEDPKPFASLVIVAPDSPLPDAAARRELDVLASTFIPRCACNVYVYQGTGFVAAATRAIMLALMTVSGGKVPRKICATIPEALGFMAPILRDQARFGTADERARALAEIENRFLDRPRA